MHCSFYHSNEMHFSLFAFRFINASELKELCAKFGVTLNDSDAAEALKQLDKDNSGKIEKVHIYILFSLDLCVSLHSY